MMAEDFSARFRGYIFLRVHYGAHPGQAYYILPESGDAVLLGKPKQAFSTLKYYAQTLELSERILLLDGDRETSKKYAGRVIDLQDGRYAYVSAKTQGATVHIFHDPETAHAVLADRRAHEGISEDDFAKFIITVCPVCVRDE